MNTKKMLIGKQIIAVAQFNFQGFFKNPKTILTLGLGFILSYLLSEKALMVANMYQSPIQMIEPFLWTFGDTSSVLLASMLLVFLFSDVPKVSPVTPFYLSRIRKWKWLVGQFLYVTVSTGIYLGFMLISTSILCMKHSYVGNIWSKTAALLGYSKVGEEMMVPSSVKVMERITPYGCMGRLLFLLLCYALTLGFLILAVNFITGKNYGIFAGILYGLVGYLLSPTALQKITGLEKHEFYKINVFLGWVSPLNHATYARHSFGYDKLPTLGQSYLVFGGILLVLFLLSLKALKQYNFTNGTNVAGCGRAW